MKLKSVEEGFYSNFLLLLSAEVKLLEMEELEIQNEFRAIGEYVQGMYKTVHIQSEGISVLGIDSHLNEFKDKIKPLYKAIG